MEFKVKECAVIGLECLVTVEVINSKSVVFSFNNPIYYSFHSSNGKPRLSQDNRIEVQITGLAIGTIKVFQIKRKSVVLQFLNFDSCHQIEKRKYSNDLFGHD